MRNNRGKYISRGSKDISELGVAKSSTRILPAGSVVFSSRAPIGYVAITENELYTNQGFKSVSFFTEGHQDFIYHALIGLTESIKQRASGTTFAEISGSEFGKTLIPLPPKRESSRIVKEIESYYSALEKIQDSRARYKRILSETPTSLRQQLIQAAIQGQLVPQNPNDEPASVLLEHIAQERTAKLGKKAAKSMSRIERRGSKTYELFPDGSEKDISEDIPFEIPSSWEWSRLGTITIKLTDGSHNPPPKKTEGYRVISAQNIRHGKIEFFEHDRFTDQLGFEKENLRTDIKLGDVILGIIGGSIGNTAIYDKEDKVIAQRSIAIIRAGIPSQFLLVLLRSPLFQHCFQQASSGSAQGGIYLGALSQLLVPLPPESEQLRIVKKLDKVLSLLAL